ncbi:MAG: structural cement protein Gp24 [Waterburya sp.]
MPITSPASYAMERGYEGTIYSISLNQEVIGTQDQFVNATGDYLPFGRFVVEGTTAGDIVLPSAGTQKILGIAPVNDRFMRKAEGITGYPPRQLVPVVRKGIVLMRAETALTRGGAVFVRHTLNAVAGTWEAKGRVRNNDDTGKAVQISNARILDTVSAGEIFRLEIDLAI